MLVKKTFAIPNLSHHIKLCTEDAVCCLYGTVCLSQQVKCALKLGTGRPKHWQQGLDTLLFSSVSQRPFPWADSGVVCQAAILDVAAFKCKNSPWIPSLKHTLISDPGYRKREEKKGKAQCLYHSLLRDNLKVCSHFCIIKNKNCSSSKDPTFHCPYCLSSALMPTNICSR